VVAETAAETYSRLMADQCGIVPAQTNGAEKYKAEFIVQLDGNGCVRPDLRITLRIIASLGHGREAEAS
jgi:hypothetical protein